MVRIRVVQPFYFPSLYCNLIFLITKIKYIWFGQSFAFSFNCEIGLCLLRDKMEHSIVIVCPFYLKRVGNRAAFLEHFKSILGIELHFESILKHFVSVSNLVINCIELSFERYIFKWSQLSFLLSFSIGNSKFNLKSDIILFVVSGDIQVQEKLFKILILPKVAIRRRFPYVAVQCS